MDKLSIAFVIAFCAIALAGSKYKKQFDAIKQINKLQNSWRAGITPVSLLSYAEKRKLLGAEIPSNVNNIRRRKVGVRNDIPSAFDARHKWSSCQSIWSIKDQGNCGDCWAVSTASAASDRLCIITDYKTQLNLSAENLMTCCEDCSSIDGCEGGDTYEAWNYIQNTGIVTGGDYDSNEGCQPYQIYPTGNSAVSLRDWFTPPCETECINTNYSIPYNKDLHYGNSTYIINAEVSAIQSDLLSNGPNVAAFSVYDDFYYYTPGSVYHHVWGEKVGDHAVRLLGWGTDQESGEDYWLAANSWNRSFGDNGYFKIRRVTNYCEFESYVTGGVMKS